MEQMTPEEVKDHLCYYETQGQFLVDQHILDAQEVAAAGRTCKCDNCFTGRTKLARELLRCLEEKPTQKTYTAEEVIQLLSSWGEYVQQYEKSGRMQDWISARHWLDLYEDSKPPKR